MVKVANIPPPTDEEKLRLLVEIAGKHDESFNFENVALIKRGGVMYVSVFIPDPDSKHVGTYPQTPLETLLFNHQFAKALWGEDWKSATILDEIPNPIPGENSYMVGSIEPCWQWHLKSMVISEDPLDYMYRSVVNE